MIPYRPIPPLAAGPRKGWASVLAAVVMAALGVQPQQVSGSRTRPAPWPHGPAPACSLPPPA